MTVTPYTKEYIHTKDLDKWFDYNPDTKEMTFNGDSLVVMIPKRYEVYQLLNIAETVKTLAVVDLIINDTYHAGLLMLATIEIEPDDVSQVMVGDVPYLALSLSTGSRFICNTERIAEGSIVYSLWMEFITRGKLIYNVDYDTLATLFDQAKAMCDSNINVDHVIFEVIYSHLCRDPGNLSVQYRHTDQKDGFKLIPLRNVGYATTSTTSRLLGSYFGAALNSSLIQTVEERTPFEDLLRS
jgi:hypothetical protein